MTILALTGTRVRERRLAAGLRQAQLAAAVGISASYLNLIEHDRRRVAEPLLARIAAVLGLPLATLQEGAEGVLVDGLRAAAAEVPEAGAEVARVEDFTSRFPGWAATLAALSQRSRALNRALEAVSDRMSHDPHLSASLHEVLSAVSSVRSTAAILADTPDLDPEWAARFHRNLHQDSERLAVGAEALVAYLDAGGQAEEQGLASPQEEVEAWAMARDWDLAADEGAPPLASQAAGQLRAALLAQAAQDRDAMPDASFAAAMARSGAEPLDLAARFGGDVLAAFRRLALRPGSGMGLVICDGSGTLTLRKPIAGFGLPRFGAACPLWPLFAALGRPSTPVEAVIAMPGPQGARFAVKAWCQTRFPAGFRGPELREAAMLILPAPRGAEGASPVGSTCRICLQPGCAARREPSILTA
jgi:transcriptional regulator with XRE-family HTH domain/predicted transcriptional regulator